MKRNNKKWMLVLVCFILITSPVYGFTSEEVVVESNGQLLSQLTTIAGEGSYDDAVTDASLMEATFRNPLFILPMPDGSYLVSDSENHVIRQIANGRVTLYAGFHLLDKDEMGLPVGALIDGPRDEAVFQRPSGLALDAEGNVYVADSGNHAIRKIDPDGNVTTVAGNGVLGFADGKGSEARFHSPMGVAIGQDGLLYVADTGNHAIRVIDEEGQVTTLNASSERIVEIVPGIIEEAGDYLDGPLSEALFNEPYAIAVDDIGNLYVSDSGNQLIRYIDLEAGTVSTVAGTIREPFFEPGSLYAEGAYADGPALQAAFHAPKGLFLNDDGSLLIADSLNHTIRLLKDGQVSTVAGNMDADHGLTDGINGFNALYNPTNVVAFNESVLIADTYNQVIRELKWFTLPVAAMENDQVDLLMDGDWLDIKADAITIKEGRVMVAADEVAQALDLNYVVEDQTGMEIKTDDQTFKFNVGQTHIQVITNEDQRQIEMDVAPYVSDENVYVPIRFLAEMLDLQVDWHPDSKTVIIRHKQL